ncbi:hypothetical protein [Methylopila sp. M107]|uniref:hypothetical protein n=1 Tax=Methylopila sp. M107 TaxID=1101190 RepID=UPI00035D3B0C|nr:hypothetical protein [Methylopila sp. M107]
MKSRIFAAGALALGFVLSCASAGAADRKVTIQNLTSSTMTEFYASNTGQDDWEEDILGKGQLNPGEEIEIDIDDGTGKCKFDFQGVFGKQKVVKRNVNVCKVGTFTFND